MFEWLPWLLLAALGIFAMGWMVARVDVKQLLMESRAMPQAYFRGLNFLMNEQPDKAIESFIEVTRAHPEAVELQFALGSLFRRRGEVDRAIRMHQELSERAGLSVEQRTAALLAMAMDYQKAGLLDHAERILVDVSMKGAGTVAQQGEAVSQLRDVYVQERDWEKAIAAAERLRAGAGEGDVKEIANFHCELAAAAQKQGKFDDAFANLDAALAVNDKCVRANLMRGSWLAAAGRDEEAIVAWRLIEQQNPDYLGLMAEAMLESYEKLGRSAEGLAELRRWQRTYPALDLLNALFRATLDTDGPQAAYELVKDDLRRNPTLVGLDRLLEAQLLAAPTERKADLQVLKDLVHAHAQRLAVYLCGQCGFKARQFYWQCPACGGWETFPPRLTAEYDLSERHLVKAHVDQQQANS